MLQDTTDSIQSGLAQVAVLVTSEGVFAVFPDRGVAVHARTVVTEDWLRHEGCRFAMLESSVLGSVLQLVHVVSSGDHGGEFHADFALTSGSNFVVVNFQLDAHGSHVLSDFGTQIHQGVLWSNWEVAAFVTDFVTEVVAVVATGGPSSFNRVDFVERTTLGAFVADAVEDEEFWLWAEENGVTDAKRLQVGQGFFGDRTWAAVVWLTGTWLDDVANDVQSWLLTERIDVSGRWRLASATCQIYRSISKRGSMNRQMQRRLRTRSSSTKLAGNGEGLQGTKTGRRIAG